MKKQNLGEQDILIALPTQATLSGELVLAGEA